MKATIATIICIVAFVGGMVLLMRGNPSTVRPTQSPLPVVNGTQIIDITAKGGYAPRVISAKAGIPTTIRVATNGTFDCSAALTIPDIGYRQILPQTGVTDIPVQPQKLGTILRGLCSMGMYSFTITFR